MVATGRAQAQAQFEKLYNTETEMVMSKNYQELLKARSVHCDTNEYRHSSPQSQRLLTSDRALAPALMRVTSRPNRKILPKKSGVTPVRAAFPPN